MKILGPWQYRKFLRWANRFFRIMPWLWFGGVGAVLAISIFHLDTRYGISMGIICALTIWPAIIGWLAITGFSIVWKFALAVIRTSRRKERPDSLALVWSLSVLLAGIVFLGGAVAFILMLLKQALAHR